PTNDLAAIVGRGGVAVGAAQRWQRGHLSVLPAETLAGMPVRRKCGEEDMAGRTGLAERIYVGSLRNTNDDAVVVLHRPGHGAVGSTKITEGSEVSVEPQRRFRKIVAGEVGNAYHPPAFVDADSLPLDTAGRGQGGDRVGGLGDCE